MRGGRVECERETETVNGSEVKGRYSRRERERQVKMRMRMRMTMTMTLREVQHLSIQGERGVGVGAGVGEVVAVSAVQQHFQQNKRNGQ